MSSYLTKNGVSVRKRITLTNEDFIEALKLLPVAEMRKILSYFSTVGDVAGATDWFNNATEADRVSFLANVGVRTVKVSTVNVNTLDVTSSFIKAIGHDKAENRMQIDFQSGVSHQYLNVPRSVYTDLLEAAADPSSSVGRLYNQIVKGSYESVTV